MKFEGPYNRGELTQDELIEVKAIANRVINEVEKYKLKAQDIKQQAYRFLSQNQFLNNNSKNFSKYLGKVIRYSIGEFKRRGLDSRGTYKISKSGEVRDARNKITVYPFNNSNFSKQEISEMIKDARKLRNEQVSRGADEEKLDEIGY